MIHSCCQLQEINPLLFGTLILQKKVKKLSKAHNGSIKSLSFYDINTFASCSRDSFIKIWDLRCDCNIPILFLENVHKSNFYERNYADIVCTNKNGILCVLFNPLSNNLYSTGENDTLVKQWDIRFIKLLPKKPIPISTFGFLESKNSGKGFTSLKLTKNNTLLVNCTNNNVYGYSNVNLNSSFLPTLQFYGHKVDNYTKLNVLCNRFLISGSTDGFTYIWKIDYNKKNLKIFPTNILKHTNDDITSVECDEIYNIYTCSDDQTINKWSIMDNTESNHHLNYKNIIYNKSSKRN